MTFSKVVETLSLMRKRNADGRALKMSRARDRIKAENKARIEKVLSAMRLGRRNESIIGRVQRAPAHLRPILTTFLSPEFKNAFVAYAKKIARGEITVPFTNAPTTTSDASSSTAASVVTTLKTGAEARATGRAVEIEGSGESAAIAPAGNPPPRRAISLDYPETFPGHVAKTVAAASVPRLVRDAERRRKAMFGDAPPTKSEATLIAAGKHRESTSPTAVRNGGVGAGKPKQRKRRGQGGSRSGSTSGVKWRKHSETSAFDMTLTADTAKGRAARTPSQESGDGGTTTAQTGEGWR